METNFLSFFVVKLKQIHIDKGITAGYSTNIPQCHGLPVPTSFQAYLTPSQRIGFHPGLEPMVNN